MGVVGLSKRICNAAHWVGNHICIQDAQPKPKHDDLHEIPSQIGTLRNMQPKEVKSSSLGVRPSKIVGEFFYSYEPDTQPPLPKNRLQRHASRLYNMRL